jgi:hypothetical protein
MTVRLFGRLAGLGYIHDILGFEFVLRSGFWVLGSEPAPTSLIVKRCVEQSSIRLLLVLGQSCPCRLWGKIACVAAAGHQGKCGVSTHLSLSILSLPCPPMMSDGWRRDRKVHLRGKQRDKERGREEESRGEERRGKRRVEEMMGGKKRIREQRSVEERRRGGGGEGGDGGRGG